MISIFSEDSMLNKQALVALAACIPILPTVFADLSKTPPMSFC